MGLLVIQETESVTVEEHSVFKSEQAFPARTSDLYKKFHFCNKKEHLKVNCFKNPQSQWYKG